MKVAASRSASLPVEIMWLSPISCCWASAAMKPAVAPLCAMTAIEPGWRGERKPPVQSGTLSRKLTRPRQLGPSRAIPCLRTIPASRS